MRQNVAFENSLAVGVLRSQVANSTRKGINAGDLYRKLKAIGFKLSSKEKQPGALVSWWTNPNSISMEHLADVLGAKYDNDTVLGESIRGENYSIEPQGSGSIVVMVFKGPGKEKREIGLDIDSAKQWRADQGYFNGPYHSAQSMEKLYDGLVKIAPDDETAMNDILNETLPMIAKQLLGGGMALIGGGYAYWPLNKSLKMWQAQDGSELHKDLLGILVEHVAYDLGVDNLWVEDEEELAELGIIGKKPESQEEWDYMAKKDRGGNVG